MDALQFDLVSPEKLLFSESAEMVVIPGTEGDFGVMPAHIPMLSTIRPGVIAVYNNKDVSDRIFVVGGFAEVTGDRCTVLAEEAFPVSELTSAIVAERRKKAEAELADADSAPLRAMAEQQIRIVEEMEKAIA
jgi:F-type H+-transporting ATPase subunit epsilon